MNLLDYILIWFPILLSNFLLGIISRQADSNTERIEELEKFLLNDNEDDYND